MSIYISTGILSIIVEEVVTFLSVPWMYLNENLAPVFVMGFTIFFVPDVLGLEQFTLGHDHGGSQDHSRAV